MKKALLILLILLPFLSKAQLATGEWKVYPVFADKITTMLETSEKVYYLSQGNLFSYDKDTEELYSYLVVNKLSDKEISNIYYNKTNRYLLISYESGNIDLLYDDGKVVNMSDIKDAIMTSEKTINDVAFGNNRIYVATAFGLVVFDDQKHYVIESGIYNKKLEVIEVVGNNILTFYNYAVYTSNIEDSHMSFDSFVKITEGVINDFKTINNRQALFLNDNVNTLQLVTFDFEKNICVSRNNLGYNGCEYVVESKDAFFVFNSTSIGIINAEGNLTTIELPSELQGKSISMWNDANTLWAGDAGGLGQYQIKDGAVTVLKDTFKPESTTVKDAFYLSLGNSGKIYVASTGSHVAFNSFSDYTMSQINAISNGNIENALPTMNKNTNKNGPAYGYDGFLFASHKVMEDPEDPNTIYIGSFWDGLYKVTNGVSNLKYDWTNSTITCVEGGWACEVQSFDFDRNNNLWVLQVNDVGKPQLHMLKAALRKNDTTTAADWKSINLGNFEFGKDNLIHVCKKSNMILISQGKWDSSLTGYDTKGTYDNTSDDEFVIWEKFIDQDGKGFDPTYICAIAEDKNGKVWLGTDNGVVEITKPANLTNPDMNINRIKVPRNDGTQLADYLLESIIVTSIAVDNSNRKWIGTETSGLYLVSENGDEIIEHFTMANSLLPSNKIYSLLCDPTNNSVYIGTDVGLVQYSSTSAPSEEDYSNVYAYPNPVRPEYTGWITIKGLMEDSLVKITDAAGNLIYTTQSEGGMVAWDGCNTNGQRVKTGVYYVFASQSEDGQSSTGAVTKILVVN